ncbi:MAG: dihydrofolate reductase [Patescibacteria group bacterium]
MIRFIAALDEKRGIADEHGIPWMGKIPGDVAYFRNKTKGFPILMGMGFYNELSKPLEDRRNMVLTTQDIQLRPGFEKISDADELFQNFNEDIWVGGGAAVFASTIKYANELYLTLIDGDFNCTKFFPEYENDFGKISSKPLINENGISYSFTVWKRK